MAVPKLLLFQSLEHVEVPGQLQRQGRRRELRSANRTLDPGFRRGDDNYEDHWTGGYIFENEWQSFRTRRDRNLELRSAPHTYRQRGRYTVAVKVIDIFGNDTMVLAPVTVG